MSSSVKTLSRESVGSTLQASTPRTRRKWKRYSWQTFYVFVAPWLIGFFLLTAAPLIYALLVSFTNFDGLSGYWRWVGLQNYQEIFQNTQAVVSLLRTLLYTIIVVPLSVGGGLLLAVLLNQRVRAMGVFRTIFYLPSVVPIVASTIMWKLIFDTNNGPVNALIEHFGGQGAVWLLDPNAFKVLIIVALWGLGGGMVISLAALQGVPQELIEGASIDGANGWRIFWHVMLPLLSPVLFFQLVTSFIAAMQTFVQPLLLAPTTASQGSGLVAPQNVPEGTYLYMVHVYAQFFNFNRFGYGSALLWVLFIAILLVTILFFRTSALWVFYEVERD